MAGFTRRQLLAGLGGAASVAGCLADGSAAPSTSQTPTNNRPIPTRTYQDSTSWPQRGSDPGHSGVTTATGVPETAESHRLVEVKRSRPPIVAGGAVVHIVPTPDAESETDLVARDLPDGTVRWRQRFDHIFGWPVAADGAVVVGGRGTIAALRTSDGAEGWRVDVGARTASVGAAIDGTVLVSTSIRRESDRKPDVRAYRSTDGELLWKRDAPLWLPHLAALGDTVFSRSPRFQHGSVLTARTLDDGTELWTDEIDENGMPGGPVAAGDRVYVAPDDAGVIAYDVESGERVWRYSASTTNVVGVAASDDAAYLLDEDRLSVRRADDGSELWSVPTPGGAGVRGRLAVDSETVYYGTAGFPAKVVARSRGDGSNRWSYWFPRVTVVDVVTAGLVGQPAVVDGAVYTAAEDGVYRFTPPA